MKFVQILIFCSLFLSFAEGSYWHPKTVNFVGNFYSEEKVDDIDFCNKEICVSDASRMAQWMNESMNPCENFYQFVCGSLLYFVSFNLFRLVTMTIVNLKF